MSSECSMVSHARYELELLESAAAKDSDDPEGSLKMQKQVTADVMEIVETLSKQGHSGGSIGYILSLARTCVLQQNISPLQGDWTEWFYHGLDMGDMYQNVRNGAVFKEGETGRAYYLDGYVCVDPNGGKSTGGCTPKCYIEFPYTPSTKYMPRLNLIPRAEGDDTELNFEEYLFDTAQEVLAYYNMMGIEQPPEDPHVVRLGGVATLSLIEGVCGNPVCDAQMDEKE